MFGQAPAGIRPLGDNLEFVGGAFREINRALNVTV